MSVLFWYGWIIFPWLWASIGVTRSYSSHLFLCALADNRTKTFVLSKPPVVYRALWNACLWCHWYHIHIITEDRFSLVSCNSTVPSECAVMWYSYYLWFSYPNLRSVRELIYKRGFGKVDRRRTALSDNAVIEQVGDAECMTSSTSFLLNSFYYWSCILHHQ